MASYIPFQDMGKALDEKIRNLNQRVERIRNPNMTDSVRPKNIHPYPHLSDLRTQPAGDFRFEYLIPSL